MFRRTSNSDSAPAVIGKKVTPSVISSHISILGNIISEGLIDFDGSIDGNIQCQNLLVRSNARINGEVRADTVNVSGRIYGTIRARVVNLQTGSHVEGTIMHEQIVIEDGAVVDGKLKKSTKSEYAPSPITPSPIAPSFINKDENIEDHDEDALIMEHIRLIAANS